MEWVRGEIIGHGSFATVSLAKPIKHNSQYPQLMAVKSCGASHSASLKNEKLILDELFDCPQVIDCCGDSLSLENGEKLYNVLLEYAPGGALAEKVRNSSNLPEFEVRSYTKSILKGLLAIHKIGYVHCDVKLQNILVCENGAVKIADLGLAKKAGVEAEGLKCDIRGTPLYMSPETVVCGEQEAPADIWAVGCLVVEMVTGAPAWRWRQGCDGNNIGALLMRIGVGEEVPEIPGKLSDAGKDFLGKCFSKNPRKRWTAEMLLSHPFVAHEDNVNVQLEKDDQVSSTSPRCHFDFPDWGSSSGESTPLCSPEYSPEFEQSWSTDKLPACRLSELISDVEADWSVSGSWITVR